MGRARLPAAGVDATGEGGDVTGFFVGFVLGWLSAMAGRWLADKVNP